MRGHSDESRDRWVQVFGRGRYAHLARKVGSIDGQFNTADVEALCGRTMLTASILDRENHDHPLCSQCERASDSGRTEES